MARKKKTAESIADKLRDIADNVGDTETTSMSMADELDQIADSFQNNGIDRGTEDTLMRQRWALEDLKKDRDDKTVIGRVEAYKQALEVIG